MWIADGAGAAEAREGVSHVGWRGLVYNTQVLIQHVPGAVNVADGPSRLATTAEPSGTQPLAFALEAARATTAPLTILTRRVGRC